MDNFSWLRGRHSMKLGGDWRFERLDVLQPPSPTGSFQFTNILTSNLSPTGAPVAGTGNAFASFLLGQVQNFSIDIQQEILEPRAKIAEFFFQDDFKASNRLTLNLGVRYTLNFPSTVVDDRGAVFNLQTEKLDFLGQNGQLARCAKSGETELRSADRTCLPAHRQLHHSLRVRHDLDRTGRHHDPLYHAVLSRSSRPPASVRSTTSMRRSCCRTDRPCRSRIRIRIAAWGRVSLRWRGIKRADTPNNGIFPFKRPLDEHWSVEVGYLGSKLTNLGVPDVNLNQLTTEQLALGLTSPASLTQQVPNPYFGQIPPSSSSLGGPTIARQQLLRPYPRFTTVAFYRNNVGHSTYHSLQTRLERRFSDGLTFTAAYTFSKLIDDAGAVFDAAILTGPAASFQAADSFNRRLEKDESTGSIPHVFSGSFVWELPIGQNRRWDLNGWKNAMAGGWQLAGIVRLQSGSPLAVTQATNFNAFAGFGIQRPNRVGDPELPAEERSTARWFNTAAFAQAGQFTLGNASRNPVVGPGYQTLDVMLGKDVSHYGKSAA